MSTCQYTVGNILGDDIYKYSFLDLKLLRHIRRTFRARHLAMFVSARFVPCQPEHLSPEKNAERMEGAVT
jgi:hypothetical protein